MKEQIDAKRYKGSGIQIPVVALSVDSLDVSVEERRSCRSSFEITSENGVALHGKIYSTNEKIVVNNPDLQGLRQEVSVLFHGEASARGMVYEGNLVLLTNGGEFILPFRYTVVPASVETSEGRISDMDQYMELYQKHYEEAGTLFFLTDFPKVFLSDRPEQQQLYHSLMKGRHRSTILEEFLTAAGYKEPASICLDKDKIILDSGRDQEEIPILLDEPGYIRGTVYSEKNQVELSVSEFTNQDFQDGKLVVSVRKNPNYAMGSDVITIETIRQKYEIPVEWWGTIPLMSREKEEAGQVKHQRAELMHNYLYFRTGSIEFEDFDEESVHVLDDLFFLTGHPEWKLYRFHFLLMEEKKEEAENAFRELEELVEKEEMDPLYQNYFLYLRAMYYRTPESIAEAVLSIRSYYESGDHKAEALWMLIYLDREYVFNKRLQYESIKQLFESGNNSCLLYFEACDILNDNPNYMEELGKFETAVFRWGVRYGYISLSLAYQFARLALKLKYFSPSVFYIVEKLYQVEPDDRFLQVMCSLLIKGNRTERAYHEYFRAAVESNLKIIGLNEFFIRSMDFSEYEVIPQRVLIYFTYSNSLDSAERAYLYTNIIKNRELYSEVQGAYYAKMGPFVEDQLRKGRMNENLAFLYTCYQKDILEKNENGKAVCDILFCHKLICESSEIIGVYAVYPETGKETYYPLSSGTANIEVFNHRTKLYFVDAKEQRYVSGIKYQLKPYMEMTQFDDSWIYHNIGNSKILLHLSGKVGGNAGEGDLIILQRIIENDDYLPWIRQQALAQLLTYYDKHQKKQELARWLARADYTNVPDDFCKNLMDYYMQAGMTENAFFGAELYGCAIMGSAKRLKLASFGVNYHKGELDETTLGLAHSAFEAKKYNRDTLNYLMRYYSGSMEEMILLWERSRKFELSTESLEEKILRQAILTGSRQSKIYEVFEVYYENRGSSSTSTAFLEYASHRSRAGDMELPSSLHKIIGKEILAGQIDDRMTMTDFLYYFADRTDWKEKVQEEASMIIGRFLKEEYYLPVYHKYEDYVRLPVEYDELAFVSYHSGEGHEVRLIYQIQEQDNDLKEKVLQEVLPGLYVCSMHFFQNDHVDYSLEDEGEVVKEDEKLVFETFRYEREDSRFFDLNYLDSKDAGISDLQQYVLKTFFTDEKMKIF